MAIPVGHNSPEGAGFAKPHQLVAANQSSSVQAIVLSAVLVVAFGPILVGMYGSWFDERSYMEHGILVIPAAAYMAWAKRDKLSAVPLHPSFWGLALLLWG